MSSPNRNGLISSKAAQRNDQVFATETMVEGNYICYRSLYMNNSDLLEAFLNSWDKNNQILVNLLGALPAGGLEAKITATSHSVSEMFVHLYHERMVSLSEEVPELDAVVPQKEWQFESNREVIAEKLNSSARLVRTAVKKRIEEGRKTDLNYDHPIPLIQLLIFHDAYHHGQIKSALKVAGIPLSDDIAGPLTWDVWRVRTHTDKNK